MVLSIKFMSSQHGRSVFLSLAQSSQYQFGHCWEGVEQCGGSFFRILCTSSPVVGGGAFSGWFEMTDIANLDVL